MSWRLSRRNRHQPRVADVQRRGKVSHDADEGDGWSSLPSFQCLRSWREAVALPVSVPAHWNGAHARLFVLAASKAGFAAGTPRKQTGWAWTLWWSARVVSAASGE